MFGHGRVLPPESRNLDAAYEIARLFKSTFRNSTFPNRTLVIHNLDASYQLDSST